MSAKRTEQNILLTTMSTIRNRNTVNYYYDSTQKEDTERKQYLTGIASIEPGAKYYLADSGKNITSVVILGSEETYKETDKLQSDDLCAEYAALKNINISDMSDFTFFKYRIAQYLMREQIEEDKTGNNITDKRKDRIAQIVADTLQGKGLTAPNTWFSDICSSEKPKNYSDSIKNAIEADIEQHFTKAEDYDIYVKPAEFPKDIAQLSYSDLKEQLKCINEELDRRRTATLENESYLYHAADCLDRLISAVGQKEPDEKQKILLNEIKKTGQKIICSTDSMKKQRAQEETAYAKYYIYLNLDKKAKLLYKRNTPKIQYTFVPEKTKDDNDIIVAAC